jgi:hypothetical protein
MAGIQHGAGFLNGLSMFCASVGHSVCHRREKPRKPPFPILFAVERGNGNCGENQVAGDLCPVAENRKRLFLSLLICGMDNALWERISRRGG